MSCHVEIRRWATALGCLIISLPKKIYFDIFPLKFFQEWGEQKVEVINHQHYNSFSH